MRFRFAAVLVMLATVCGPAWSQETLHGTITRRADDRIGIAVPSFATAPGMEMLGQQLSAVLTYDLAFTGLFNVVDPHGYPPGFAGFTRDPRRIDFGPWRDTQAEFLVHGYLYQENDRYVTECRLFEVLGGANIEGWLLRGDRRWLRLLAHQFSEAIVKHLTGVPGIASSQICFSGGETGHKEIYVADYDGANVRAVTKHDSISILPKFSPDGTKIAYMSYKDRFPFLYVLDIRTGVSVPLSKSAGMNVGAAWSPDGKRLAMALSREANAEIYLVDPDGSNRQRLTNHPAVDSSPSFSPDGKQICFISERSGAPQVFVMNLDGSSPRRISFQGGRSYDPVWSPNGEYIAYVAEKGGAGLEVYVMDADGRNPHALTDSRGSNENPGWSPDSRHIIFSSTRSGRWELYTVNVDTKETRRVPNLSVRAQGPDWGPRRK